MKFREVVNNPNGAFRLRDFRIFRMAVFSGVPSKHKLLYRPDKILFFVERALGDGWAAILSCKRFALVYGLAAIFGKLRQDKFYTYAWHGFRHKCKP